MRDRSYATCPHSRLDANDPDTGRKDMRRSVSGIRIALASPGAADGDVGLEVAPRVDKRPGAARALRAMPLWPAHGSTGATGWRRQRCAPIATQRRFDGLKPGGD